MPRWILLFCAPAVMLAQTAAPTASISGRFIAPGGHALHGYLYLTGQALGSASRKVYAGADDGSFQFTALPAGLYFICTRSTFDQAPSSEEPFLDSCAWPVFAHKVHLTAGQALTGVAVQAQPGVRLHVRVNAAAAGTLSALPNPGAVDPNLELHVRGADQLIHIMPVVNTDSAGRDHAVIVPHDTYLILRSASKTLSLKLPTGQAVPAEQQLFLKSGALPAQITFQAVKLP